MLQLTDDRAVAEHDGYAPLGVIHRREVALGERTATVVDHLLGTGRVRIRIPWHLVGDEAPRGDGPSWIVPGERWSLRITADRPLTALRGPPHPGPGWASPRYGVRRPAWALVHEGEVELPLAIRTELAWEPR